MAAVAPISGAAEPPADGGRGSRWIRLTEGDRSESTLVSNSLTGSVWTLISRVTGLVRIIVVGAVLGATYLGNTYQAINSLPNLIYYQLLAGSLFVSLLVPPLVAHIRAGDSARAEGLVRDFLGSLIALAVGAAALLVVAGPLILHLLSLGVTDSGSAAAQRRVGLLFLVLFAPQILFYVVAGTGAAVMNAYGRFALAAAAPTVESIGMILTLVAAAAIFSGSVSLSHISTSEVLLLGLGTTAAVALHATVQWWGARRRGITMLPRAGWRDPEVRKLLRRIRSVLAYTGLATLQLFAMMIVANRVAGGLVAFQLALNFFYLPAAIVTWPIARALTPRLANFHQTGNMRAFRDEFLHAISLASFVAIPIAVAYAASAPAIAHTVAVGRLSTAAGKTYVAASLLALSPAVIAETWFTLGSYGLYAQQDVAGPLRAMALRVGVSMLLMIPAFAVHGATTLIVIGAAMAVGSSIGAIHVCRRASRPLPRSEYSLRHSILRTALVSVTMVLPAVGAWVVI
jgi:putative peptidoglycan lipid II flippase